MRIKLTFLVSVITIFLMAGCGFKVVNQSGLIDFKIEKGGKPYSVSINARNNGNTQGTLEVQKIKPLS